MPRPDRPAVPPRSLGSCPHGGRRFYDRAGPFTLGEIAGRIGAEVAKGDPADLKLTDVAALEGAEGGDISLFSDAKYANAFAVTKASVVITSAKLAGLPHGVVVLVVPNPRLAFAQVGQFLSARN